MRPVPALAAPQLRGPLAALGFWLGALAGFSAQPAAAHPLGNSSVNHLTYVKVFPNRVSLLYVLDQAEYPTLRDLRAMSPRQLFLAKVAEVRRHLRVTVDGRRQAVDVKPNAQLRFRRGVGGLTTVRIALPVIAYVREPRRVQVHDGTFAGRRGVVLVVPLGAAGTAVRRLDGPVGDPSAGLRLAPPAGEYEDRTAVLAVRPGQGTVAGTGPVRTARPARGQPEFRQAPDRRGDTFSRLFDRAAAGEGVFLLLLAAAFAWGALHALSPGHGKGMVAAYLVGTRGSPADALALGGIVTLTHTAGVFAIGLVTLVLSDYFLPDDLYPWLNLAAGLLIVAVGIGVLGSRIRWARRQRAGAAEVHGDDQREHDEHEHHEHEHHEHEHHEHEHHRHHHHAGNHRRGLLAMGVSAGLIPCPSALVVLLAALTQHRVGLGLVLIVAFSLGLAVTLTALGLAVVYGKRASARLPAARRLAASRLGAALPALSTLLILGLGVLLTVRALPGVL